MPDTTDLVRLKPDTTPDSVRLKPDTTSDLVRLKPDTTSDLVRLKPDTTTDLVGAEAGHDDGSERTPRLPERTPGLRLIRRGVRLQADQVRRGLFRSRDLENGAVNVLDVLAERV